MIAWNGVIVDGNTRASVADELGLDVLVSDREFDTVADALDYAVHCQKDRRNMTNAGIRAAVEALDEKEMPAARERQGARSDLRTSVPSDTEVKKGRSCEQIGKILGIGSSTVSRVRAINKGPEEIREKVKSGELSIHKGAELARG